MLAVGFITFTFGYALTWVGVERFRGKDVSLITALGATGGQTTKISGSGSSASRKPGILGDIINFAVDGPAVGALKALGL